MTADRRAILSVQNLTTCFRTDRGTVRAVDEVSFDVFPGEVLGIVGESGCGKTVTSKSVMRLLPERTSFFAPGSRMLFRPAAKQTGNSKDTLPAEIDLASCNDATMRRVRGARIAMIFQEPMTSLNPVFTVGWQIEEALKYHTSLSGPERRARVVEMLKLVEIPNAEKRAGEYPHQLSGGMRQRVMIAIALCCEPELLIADEPTTALDVTIQAQILQLMEGLRRRLGTAVMLITHNLGVVAQVCDRVMVMYAGRVVEQGGVHEIFRSPRHPYTAALLGSIPKAGKREGGRRLPIIPGIVPSLFDLPKGCRFQDRCASRQDRCVASEPTLDPVQGPPGGDPSAPPRLVRCHFPVQVTTTPRTIGSAT
jgi:peptide/nickel transport system ATP-binding protein